MKNSKAFSLIEMMIVLTISSFIFLIVYSLISIGMRFFESFSSKFDFSVKQFIKDVEYEISFSDDFFVTNKVLNLVKSNEVIRYVLGKLDNNFSYFLIKKKYVNQRKEKTFYLKDVFDVKWSEEKTKFLKKLFISITDLKGNVTYEVYIP